MSTNRPPNFEDLTPEERDRGQRRLIRTIRGTPLPETRTEKPEFPFGDDEIRNIMRTVSKQTRSADFWVMSLPESEQNPLAAALNAGDNGVEILISQNGAAEPLCGTLRKIPRAAIRRDIDAPVDDIDFDDDVETLELTIPDMPSGHSVVDVGVFEWSDSNCPVVSKEGRWPLLSGRLPHTASDLPSQTNAIALGAKKAVESDIPVLSATAGRLEWTLFDDGMLAVKTKQDDEFLAVELTTKTASGVRTTRTTVPMSGRGVERFGQKALHPPADLVSDRVTISVGPLRSTDIGRLNVFDREKLLEGRDEAVLIVHRKSDPVFELTADMTEFGHLIAAPTSAVGLRVLRPEGGVR